MWRDLIDPPIVTLLLWCYWWTWWTGGGGGWRTEREDPYLHALLREGGRTWEEEGRKEEGNSDW